jgi:uncharacterized membrane protein HdeD (DUF308 family)
MMPCLPAFAIDYNIPKTTAPEMKESIMPFFGEISVTGLIAGIIAIVAGLIIIIWPRIIAYIIGIYLIIVGVLAVIAALR